MIVFSGEVFGKCKKEIIIRAVGTHFLASSLASIPFFVIFIFATIKEDRIFLLAILGLIFAVLMLSMVPVLEFRKGTYTPNKVTIDTKLSVIVAKGKRFCEEIWIKDVVVIRDFGEWYHIYSPKCDTVFACQKSLISQGTLMDFEKLFKNKLVTSKKEFREMIAKHRS